ncbi:MAG TPA: SDR family NAD(P)-dependent oxidoreductase [Armatimonadota bacterium]|jgi:NAD(P)-dependent dehydrogenase (short-subunit alcohol dehydrogenase family)
MKPPRTVLITGADSGIGWATARLLARHGCRVFAAIFRPDPPASQGFELLPLDVTSPASVAACVSAVVEQAGRLDVLVNNAGFGVLGPLEETTPEEARSLLEVNLLGPHRLVSAVLPVMRAQGSGLILNVSSAAALLGVPFEGMYCASKAALETYTEALRLEVRGFGVRVALVQPGLVRTSFLENAQWTAVSLEAYALLREHYTERYAHAWDKAAPPEAVAQAILRVMNRRSPAWRYSVGADAWQLNWLTRWLPRPWLHYGLARMLLRSSARR